MARFKKLIKENIWAQIIIVLVVLCIVWTFFSSVFPEHIIGPLQDDLNKKPKSLTISFIYYFFAIYLSGLLTWIAYSNFSRLNKEIKAKFLLEIDKRWGETQIIEAREVIHQFYLDARKITQGKECQIEIISNGILALSRSEEEKHIKQYVRILNFLDFMETVGYLYSTEDVTFEQLNELCGNTLKFNFLVFKALIKRKRSDHKDRTLYENFEKLYEALINPESKSKNSCKA